MWKLTRQEMNYIYVYNPLNYNQNYIPTLNNKDAKADHRTGGRWFIQSPKRRKENQLESLDNAPPPPPPCIILSLLCKSDIKEVHSVLSNSLLADKL